MIEGTDVGNEGSGISVDEASRMIDESVERILNKFTKTMEVIKEFAETYKEIAPNGFIESTETGEATELIYS